MLHLVYNGGFMKWLLDDQFCVWAWGMGHMFVKQLSQCLHVPLMEVVHSLSLLGKEGLSHSNHQGPAQASHNEYIDKKAPQPI